MSPIKVSSYDGDRLICTDLLINGHPWNQSWIQPNTTQYNEAGHNLCPATMGATSDCPPIGMLGNNFPVRGVTYLGNTHSPAHRDQNSHCTFYAAIHAFAVVGLTATSNIMADSLPAFASKKAALIRVETSTLASIASDINLIGNIASKPFLETQQDYGWSPLIDVVGSNRSISDSSHHSGGEAPLHTFYAPEIAQRNFYASGCLSAGSCHWTDLAGGGGKPTLAVEAFGYDGLETVVWTPKATYDSVLVWSLNLERMPSLRGQTVYFAMNWSPQSVTNGSHLGLMIDSGSGVFDRVSNGSGLVCANTQLSRDCNKWRDVAPKPKEWRMRVFATSLGQNGTARFAVREIGERPGPHELAGVVIALVGARYETVALRTDDASATA